MLVFRVRVVVLLTKQSSTTMIGQATKDGFLREAVEHSYIAPTQKAFRNIHRSVHRNIFL